MICLKCKTEEAGEKKYCKACRAEYMKDYRLKKVAESAGEPVLSAIAEEVIEDVRSPKYVHKEHVAIHPFFTNPIYWSYYVTQGTELHKFLLRYEKDLRAVA